MSYFKESLFGCFNDCGSCLVGFFVPCGSVCLQAVAVNKIRKHGFLTPYCIGYCGGALGAAVNRQRIKEYFGYPQSFWCDWVLWQHCGQCASCQEYREVKKHAHHDGNHGGHH